MSAFSMIALNNAGVYLRTEGVTLLLDALEDGYSPYAAASWELLSLSADALLFTHKHPDHFSARMTFAYLQRYPACRVFAGGETIRTLEALQVPSCQLVTLEAYVPAALGERLSVTAWPARHIGPEYRHKEHYALLLESQSHRILFTGDAAPVHNSFERENGSIGAVDLMVAPYVYALYEPAQRLFGKSVETKALVANHIPEPDAEGIRAQLYAIPPSARDYRLIVSETNTEVEAEL